MTKPKSECMIDGCDEPAEYSHDIFCEDHNHLADSVALAREKLWDNEIVEAFIVQCNDCGDEYVLEGEARDGGLYCVSCDSDNVFATEIKIHGDQ